jgi:hypothetical protein
VLERQAIWVAAMLSALLWPLAMRAFDPGYPSFSVPLMRVGSAALVWLLCASGVVYLIEKEIESRALMLIGAFLLLLSAVTIRVIAEKNGKDKPIASVEMPMLGAAVGVAQATSHVRRSHVVPIAVGVAAWLVVPGRGW